MTIKKFGRYEVKRALGRGGMAVVYLVHDPEIDREVAVKVLFGDLNEDPQFRNRFRREVRTIARLQNPCIVSIYDFGEEENQPYIVMQYMPGGSLLSRLRKGRFDLPGLIPIVTRVARALDYAHSQQIIHRDLKPGNILFDDLDYAYLSDFGIAKVIAATTSYTGSGVIGTPAYMSPEQGNEKTALDGRSDVYALGIVVFEALTGELPYQADTPIALMMKHITAEIPHIYDVRPDLPRGCDVVIKQALAKVPEERYASANDLAADLAKVAQGQTIYPRPELYGHGTELVTENSSPRGQVGSTAESPGDSGGKRPWWRWWPILVGLVGLLLAGSFAGGIWPLPAMPTPTPELLIANQTAEPFATMSVDVSSATPTVVPTDALETKPTNTSQSEPTPTDTAEPSPTPTDTTEPSPTPKKPLVATTPLEKLTPTETSQTELKLTPTNTLVPALPAAPDRSGRLAIPLMLGNEPKVYLATLKDGQLQGSLAFARQPDYTTDGTKLVVNGEGGAEDKLRVSDPVGNGSYQIGDPGLNGHSHPSWSPDGTRLIYDDLTVDPTGWRIFIRDLATTVGPGSLLEAAAGPIIGQYPLWTSQDRFIFRGCNTWANLPSNCGIWIMEGNPGTPAKLTSDPNHIPVDVRGNKIVYVSAEEGDWNVYALDLPNGAVRQLTSDPAADGLPAISPDGRTVAFLSNREGRLAVWLVGIAGGTAEKLFDLPLEWGQLRENGWSEERLTWGAD